MLSELFIQNIVLIKSLTLRFHEGFTSITGETGAGKSILLTSLDMICGQRASAAIIRTGEEKAQITARFVLPPSHPARTLLGEHDLPHDEDELIIRRSITRKGRSQIWVNDIAVTLSFLRSLASTLLEIQGQHAQLDLMSSHAPQIYLDHFCVPLPISNKVKKTYGEWHHLNHLREEKKEDVAQAKREEAYLRHTDKELDDLAPGAEEEENLAQQRTILKQREKQGQAATDAYKELTAQDSPSPSALNMVNDVLRLLQTNTPGDGGEESLSPVIEYLQKAGDELSEAEALLDTYLHQNTPSTQELDEIEARLFKIREIARKHNILTHDIAAFHKDIKNKLYQIEHADHDFQQLNEACQKASQRYLTASQKLHDLRIKGAPIMAKAIEGELKPLGLEKAQFFINVSQKASSDFSPQGQDEVAFLIATNPGQEAGALNNTVSGGELSRIALALRVLDKKESPSQTLIFDEIDTGIGGATASAVGMRLHILSQKDQIIAVTHNPQVAAQADEQLHLSKHSHHNETTTTAQILDEKGRIEEIARMFSAGEITNSARQTARNLLKRT